MTAIPVVPVALDNWPTKQGLRIGFLNINDATNKFDDIKSIIHNSGNPFHIFGFAESRLTSHTLDDNIHIPGYHKPIRLDPHKPKTTGLLIYVASSVIHKRLTSLEAYDVETIWLQINMKNNKPFLIGFIYRNPAETVKWIDNFNSLMDDVTMKNYETFILGDFNIDLVKSKPTWHQNYSLHSLEQLVDRPTRVTSHSATIIDHIYTNSKQRIIEVCVPSVNCSDHCSVSITWFKKNVKIPSVGHKTIFYRCFKNFNENDFLNELKQSNLDYVYQIRDPDTAFNFWIKEFNSIYCKHAPFKKKRVRQKAKPPWITKEIETEIYYRDHLLKYGTREQFKIQRNKVNSMKRKSKYKYIQELILSKKDSRQIWNAINLLMNNRTKKRQQIITEVSPDTLNDHFSNIANKVIVVDRSNDNDLSRLQNYINSKQIHSNFNLPPMTVFDVAQCLSGMTKSNTRDLCCLDSKILKLACPVITETLTYLYNLCLDKQYFPLVLKQAKVIPILKSGDPSDPSNYRPISILSVLSKPLEKHIFKYLYSYFINNNLINENQSGFRKNHSCHTALIQLVDNLLLNINENKFTGILFVDFAKAFDVISHPLLLRKLQLYRLNSDFIHLMKSFLSDRKQAVVTNNSTSKFMPVKYGVPQGSILGPLLFLMYVNDLPYSIKCPCGMFADDTNLQSSDHDACKVVSNMQTYIDKLVDWTELNHMSLNAMKTKCMYVAARQKRQKMTIPFKPLFIRQQKIEQVKSHKILGVTLDEDLSWTNHITSLIKLLSNKIAQFSKIKNFLDTHTRKIFFNAHILSLVDYGSTLWDKCSETNLKLINRMYKKALKIVMLKSNSLSIDDYKYLNVLNFENRLVFNKSICMHNVITGNAPPKITKAFKTNLYRHTHSLSFPRPRSDLFKASFLYSGGTLWNNLPAGLKNIKSKRLFKKKMKQHLMTKIKL